jgi:hypothetical protein
VITPSRTAALRAASRSSSEARGSDPRSSFDAGVPRPAGAAAASVEVAAAAVGVAAAWVGVAAARAAVGAAWAGVGAARAGVAAASASVVVPAARTSGSAAESVAASGDSVEVTAEALASGTAPSCSLGPGAAPEAPPRALTLWLPAAVPVPSAVPVGVLSEAIPGSSMTRGPASGEGSAGTPSRSPGVGADSAGSSLTGNALVSGAASSCASCAFRSFHSFREDGVVPPSMAATPSGPASAERAAVLPVCPPSTPSASGPVGGVLSVFATALSPRGMLAGTAPGAFDTTGPSRTSPVGSPPRGAGLRR